MSESNATSASLSKVRHDMRTPINHILGYSELLAEEAAEMQPDALAADLNKIRTAAQMLLGLIDKHLSDDGVAKLLAGESAVSDVRETHDSGERLPEAVAADESSIVAGRILVVDDNPENCETLSRRLVKQGHEVAVAYNGLNALEILREGAFDLVLLDILMPGIDGYGVLNTMKSETRLRHIPVIMISALDQMESVVRCIESGAEDYLSKPFNPTLLRARIGASLEKKALRDDEQQHLRVIEETQDRLKHELDEAARYVRSIIPAPIDEPVKIDWCYIPSTELGGDAFGYHLIDEHHFAIYLLDVCGHGVGASLLSVTAMNVIRSGSLAGTDFRDPAQVLKALNDAFPMERQNNMYFTIWYGVFDLRTRVLSHASGGHPPAILIEAGGSVSELRAPGLLIGAVEGMDYRSETTEIPPGAQLLVFSDGVYEITRSDGTMAALDDFKAVAVEFAKDPDELAKLSNWATDLQGSPTLEDDYSLIRVQF